MLTFNYLRQSIEVLLEFAILLVFSLWRKHLPDEEPKAFEMINQTAFKLIQQREYTVSIRVLEYVLGLEKTKVTVQTRMMMVVNLASSYGHLKDDAKCNEILDGQDWSGSSDDYHICVAALKRDISKVCRLLPVVASAGSVNKDDIRDWPVFDFIRDKPEIMEKFEQTYGEPLLRKKPRETVDVLEEAEDTPPPSTTFH